MRVTIFLGPTMRLQDARQILPEAVFRPPAAQGDLLAAAEQDGAEIVGLIDGTFHQNLSVWHNEVCYLLSRGITIFGSSSMGALRAVETERFGAVGVGQIFAWYRDGVINSDDEVALLHGEAEAAFRPLSLPLVNIRASLANAVAAGALDTARADELVTFARSLYYPERQTPALVHCCRQAGFPEGQLRAVERALTAGYVDLKRSDAEELLLRIRDILDGVAERPAPVKFTFTRSASFETLYSLDKQVRVGDVHVRLQDIAEHSALHCPDFKSIRRTALDRDVVVVFAWLLGMRATEEEVEEQRTRFAQEHELASEEQIVAWLEANALGEGEWREYLAQEAVCARLRRWAATARSFDRGCNAVLNEMRARGTFPEWASAAARAADIVAAYRDEPEYRAIDEEHPASLVDTHAAHTGVQIAGDARAWAEDAGFDGVDALADALRRSAIYNDVDARIARLMRVLDEEHSEAV